MPNRIKPALDCIAAEGELKARTVRSVTAAMRKKTPMRPSRYAPALAVCLAVVLMCGLYFTPVSTISVDINPSLELSVNCFDRVIGTAAFNKDGETLLSAVSLRYRKYEDALTLLLTCDMAKTYLTGNADVSITVLGHSEAHSAQMQQRITQCNFITNTAVYCHTGSSQALEAAHHVHLSLGKYEAYLALRTLDSTVTEETVRDLSMREIRLWIESLGGDPSISVSNSSGHNGHHQNGNHH